MVDVITFGYTVERTIDSQKSLSSDSGRYLTPTRRIVAGATSACHANIMGLRPAGLPRKVLDQGKGLMLRLAMDSDVDNIRLWRNQQKNRDVSINTHEITLDEHAQWWAAVQNEPTRRVLIYERGGIPSGVVNFFDLSLHTEVRTGAWGWFLDSDGLDARNETLPAFMEIMQEGIEYAFDKMGLHELKGDVLPHNAVARKVNRRFRFVEGKPEHQSVRGRTITVIPIRLHAKDRRLA